MTYPFVSVVVAVYNGRRFIAGCVGSLLAQDYPKDRYEIFMVDNGSTDGTAEEIRRYPVRSLSKPYPRGPAAPRNVAIEQARGELIAFTDIDCVADPHWLEHLVEGWQDPRFGGFVGSVEGSQTSNPIEQWMAQFYNQELNLRAGPFPFAQTNNVAYRRELFVRLGGFDENLYLFEDVEFGWRMTCRARLQYRWNPRAVIAHRNRTTLSQVARKFYIRGSGLAAAAKRIPEFRKPSIPVRSAHHGLKALVQLGKLGVRSLQTPLGASYRDARLRTTCWLTFHASMAAGLAAGACDWRNRSAAIPHFNGHA